jgi:UDP-galactopyranose mutase
MIDYLIVGCGLYGVTCARILTNKGYKCLIIDKRKHIGGNIYDKKINDILVHEYGPHVFHTNNDDIWDFVNKYSKWNQFAFQIMAKSNGEVYNLPFNMNTFHKIFNSFDPNEIKKFIQDEIDKYGVTNPINLEEQAISLVGKTVYETLIKGYTEKQWGKACTELEPFIIKRLPIRLTYDNRYFNDKYCAIPENGYTYFINNIISGVNNEKTIEYILNVDFKTFINNTKYSINNIIYTGAIDELFDYELGELEWRSLKFNTDEVTVSNFQGCAQMNYIDKDCLWTRIIEHKHFYPNKETNKNYSIITFEYPDNWKPGKEPYYPINNDSTETLYKKYIELSNIRYPNMFFGGRLGNYKYYNMDQCILEAMNFCNKR